MFDYSYVFMKYGVFAITMGTLALTPKIIYDTYFSTENHINLKLDKILFILDNEKSVNNNTNDKKLSKKSWEMDESTGSKEIVF